MKTSIPINMTEAMGLFFIVGLLVAIGIPSCQLIGRLTHHDTPPPGITIVTDHHGKWAWTDGLFISSEAGQESNSFQDAVNSAWDQYEWEQSHPDLVKAKKARAKEFTSP